MEEKKEVKDLAVVLKDHLAEIRALAPKYLNVNRMLAIFIEASRNEKLRQCSPISVLASAKKMAELGTEIVGSGGVHLVPFKNEMTVIPDWRLIVAKAVAAGVIKHATATVVHEGDAFDYEKGLEPKLFHKPAQKEKAELTHVYCVYTLPDGVKDFEVMTKKEVDKIRSISKASNFGPWVSFYEEMAKKSVIRRTLKVFEGASPELSQVIDVDNAAVGFAEIDLGEPIAEPKAIEPSSPKEESTTSSKNKDIDKKAQSKIEKEPELGEVTKAEPLF